MGTLLTTYAPTKLEPYQNPEAARTIAMQFAASLTVPKGQLIGQTTSGGKGNLYTPVNTTQLIKIQGTLSGGTFAIRALKADGTWVETAPIAYNAAASAIASALNAVLGTNAVAVAMAVDLATGATITFSGTGYAGIPQPDVVLDVDLTTGATSTSVLNNTVVTGIEVAMGLSVYDFITDSSGNVIFTTTAGLTPDFQTGLNDTAPVYIAGTFLESDLTGLDAAAIAALNAREIGIGATKTLHIP